MDTNFDVLDYPNYGIRDEQLRRQALTHPSYSYENPGEAQKNNQRLEFEGDAYLKASITSLLREMCVDWNEDRLTQLRSKIERTSSLATFAKAIRIDEHIRVGNSCQGVTDKMLEDAFEAIIGAIHREGGQNRVDQLVFPFLRETCEALAREPPRTLASLSTPLFPSSQVTDSPIFTNGRQSPSESIYDGHVFSPTPAEPVNQNQVSQILLEMESLKKAIKCQNPVSALKEWRDHLGRSDIEYKFEKAGFEHSPSWKATCIISGIVVGTAVKPGKKQEAKSAAAEDAINRILG
ncbi:3508_t:CDS:2 [Paraglomus brasilianum]|uniref:3508_t:CDS:1 n=1 Tax=Paraglomus brasilianum TaxID=144538 RepID=A0A9N9A3R3_9GLOM|nr:3508_t:CDS:2 [Paraglomus brasilianum]